MLIPLCVSKDNAKIAHGAGARWNIELHAWTCGPGDLHTKQYNLLRPFVPRRFRPDLENPVIRPWMVPQSLWGKNLRAVIHKQDWDVVRKTAYRKYGHRCGVCGGQGPKWPVEADEAWDYDDANCHSTLKGVIALCPACHAIRHWGRTSIKGREEEDRALTWMMDLNRWSRRKAREVVDDAFAQWQQRSKVRWSIDYSWVTHAYGISLLNDAGERADRINRQIVDMAWETRGA